MRRTNNNPIAEMLASFGAAQADYKIGHESRFRPRLRGVDRQGSGADYHIRNESAFYLAMEQAREFDRNDPIVGPGITRSLTNIFQGGFNLDVNTGDKALDTILTDKWNDWANEPANCHSEKEHNFNRLAELAYRAVIVDGDHLALPLNDGSVQMVEAHRLRSPRNAKKEQNVVHGVKLSDRAVREEYWITKEDLGTSTRPTKINEVSKVKAWFVDELGSARRSVLHLYDPKRTSQRRGISGMAPVADTAGMFGDTQFAMLVKQQVASCFAIFRELAIGSPANGGDGRVGERQTEPRPDGSTRVMEGLAPGLEIFGYEGEKMTGFSPNIPGEGFLAHSMLILTVIAINLGVPVAVLLLDPSNTNFSGWRGAMDEARKGWRKQQDWFCSSFHRPIYQWKVLQWLEEEGSLLRKYLTRTDVNLFGHCWNKPTWAYIEPMKDIAAGAMEMRTLQTSPRRSLAARGLNWEQIIKEIVADNMLAIIAAKTTAQEINKQFDDGHPVNWLQCLALPMPEGVSLKIADEPLRPLNRNKKEPKMLPELQSKIVADPILAKIPHANEWVGPWAIYEPAMEAVLAQLELLDLANHLNSPLAIAARERASLPVQLEVTPDQVAVIRIQGSMQKQESSLGGASTISIRKQLRAAASSEQIRGIMLLIESPGGTVSGTSELGDDIAAAGKKKPVHAYIEDMGASAAFWAASQASRISVNKMGQVGSIGTMMVIKDFSRMDDARGVKVHVVRAGQFKGAGTPGTEITADQLAMIQAHVDGVNEHFLQAVAMGRGMKLEDVRTLADGRVHLGAEALRLGLVDAVSTFDEALASLVSSFTPRSKIMSDTTKPERVVATVAEIQAGCPGATADFIVAQSLRSSTLADAQTAWMQQQASDRQKLQDDLKAEQGKTVAAEAKVKELEANKQKPGKTGVDPVGAGLSAESQDYSGDAIADWNQKIGACVAQGKSQQAAIRQLVSESPDLHAAYTAAYTAKFGPACNPKKR